MLFQADLRGVAPSNTLERLEHDPAARALLDERDSLTDEVVILPDPVAAAEGRPEHASGGDPAAASDEPHGRTPRDAAAVSGGLVESISAPEAPAEGATAAAPEAPAEGATAAAPAATGRASGWTDRPVGQTADLDGFTRVLVLGVESHRDAIEELITRYSRRWAISRMPVVDRNVLRLATYELLHEPTPPAVVIDEAIGLAKRLSTEDSGRFVNGVLESIRKDIAGAASPPAPDSDG